MALIAKLGNVQVRINSRDHHPAHIHVIDGQDEVLLVIETGEVYEGAVSSQTMRAVLDYLSNNRAMLLARFFEINHQLPR